MPKCIILSIEDGRLEQYPATIYRTFPLDRTKGETEDDLFLFLEKGEELNASISVDSWTDSQKGPKYRIPRDKLKIVTGEEEIIVKVDTVKGAVRRKLTEGLSYDDSSVVDIPHVTWGSDM